MKQILDRIKPYLRWFILGGVLFFLVKTVKDRFAEVAAVRVDSQGWSILAIAVPEPKHNLYILHFDVRKENF